MRTVLTLDVGRGTCSSDTRRGLGVSSLESGVRTSELGTSDLLYVLSVL